MKRDKLADFLLKEPSNRQSFVTDDPVEAAVAGQIMAADIVQERRRLIVHMAGTLPPGLPGPMDFTSLLPREIEKSKRSISTAELSRENQRRAKQPRKPRRSQTIEAKIIAEWRPGRSVRVVLARLEAKKNPPSLSTVQRVIAEHKKRVT